MTSLEIVAGGNQASHVLSTDIHCYPHLPIHQQVVIYSKEYNLSVKSSIQSFKKSDSGMRLDMKLKMQLKTSFSGSCTP